MGWLLKKRTKAEKKNEPKSIAEKIDNDVFIVPVVTVDKIGKYGDNITLSWSEKEAEYHLEIEEMASGQIYLIDKVHSPFSLKDRLPEGYYVARLKVLYKKKSIRRESKALFFSTLNDNYFEDKNPRPKHILSMDEGNKFRHSRRFKIVNVSPAETLPPFPQFRWYTTALDVTSFDLALFNKEKSYWVILRGIKNNNAIPAHALEPGEWFVFIKGLRAMGQSWSHPLYIKISEEANQIQDIDVVVRPKYIDDAGEYFTPEKIVKFNSGGKRSTLSNKEWVFKPDSDGNQFIGQNSRIKWPEIMGVSEYEVIFRSEEKGTVHSQTIGGIKDTSAAPIAPLDIGRYRVAVIGKMKYKDGTIMRRFRSAYLSVQVVNTPFTAGYIAMEHDVLTRLEREKAFAEHMDSILGMDYYTNLRLKRWEIENGVTNLFSLPVKLTTLVDYRCNIDCIFCDNGRVPRELPIPEKFIEDFKFFMPYCNTMQVLGGEPLMAKEFKRIVQIASKYPHLTLSTTTNGTLVDDEWAYYFARSNFTKVWMSVDGATEPVYQSMRRGGVLKDVTEGVKKIVSYGSQAPVVGWSFIIARKNYQEIIPYYKLARELGVSSVYYKMLQLRFGPNYPGVGRLDLLMDRELCEKVINDLCVVADMAKRDNIEFDERVISYVKCIHPDLAKKFLNNQAEIKSAEVEGADEVFSGVRAKKLPLPVRGHDDEQIRIFEKLVSLHKSMGNDKFPGISLNERNDNELCHLPFSHLGLNGTNAYMCCYASPKVLPINFKEQYQHLTDVWNSRRYQFSRESFYKRHVKAACLTTCPFMKDEKGVWVIGQLNG